MEMGCSCALVMTEKSRCGEVMKKVVKKISRKWQRVAVIRVKEYVSDKRLI